MLEDHGIEAVIQGENLFYARGELPFTLESFPSIWVVRDEDEPAALDVIARNEGRVNPRVCRVCGYELRGLPEARCPECGTPFRIAGEWTCAECGEVSPMQFSHCWSCGEQRNDGVTESSFGSERISRKEADTAGLPKPDCPRCHGTGVIKYRALSATFLILAIALATVVMREIDFPHFRYLPPRFFPEVFALFLFGALSLFMAYKCHTWKCSCCEDD